MPPTEKMDVNVSELNSPGNISTPAGDGPLKGAETRPEKLPTGLSLSSKSGIVKKLLAKEGVTKIPRPSSREAEGGTGKAPGEDFNTIGKTDLGSVFVARKTFRTRKSLSQMDIPRSRNSSRHSRAMVPASLALKAVSPRGETSLERSFRLSDDYYRFASGSGESEYDDSDARFAGMKIFASIMLNAWRRRRDDVRRLNEEINRMKKNSIRVKNQVHVLNSMFKIEQKQNDELNTRLRRMMDDQKKIQDMYDELNLSFVELKGKNCLVEKELLIREKEYEGLNLVLNETKTQLFKCMSHERDLESSLSSEQRRNQELENNKNELLNQMAQIKFELCDNQVKFQEHISSKEEEMNKLKNQLEALERKLSDLKAKESQVREYEKLDMAQRKIIEDLKLQMQGLQNTMNNTWGRKMKTFWASFPEKSFKCVHFFMFYLLPALPPPTIESFPKAPKLEKALSLIWNY